MTRRLQQPWPSFWFCLERPHLAFARGATGSGAAALTGTVRSAKEGLMEGVLVSARRMVRQSRPRLSRMPRVPIPSPKRGSIRAN